MAVACRQCGNSVDENAAVCPHCGVQWPGRRGAESYAGGAVAGRNGVVITDIDIPFGRMVGLILKVMFASIPAYIILFIIFAIISAVFSGLIMGMIGLGASRMH
jgi:uncharacterized membrane protein YvbJ